ncbi:hypothetical protein RRG08_036089 [Elysia crispata]|uniref:Uncharacterized protein n=1 Tax=Elysia crispata TaxID=231223 RepID=A0AAE1E0H2_9GAST|nr:hypothetical protein RRG08_036089 [Elysia crispata]
MPGSVVTARIMAGDQERFVADRWYACLFSCRHLVVDTAYLSHTVSCSTEAHKTNRTPPPSVTRRQDATGDLNGTFLHQISMK